MTEATKESMETKARNKNEVYNFIFLPKFSTHYVASASSLLVTLQGVLSNKSRTQQIKK